VRKFRRTILDRHGRIENAIEVYCDGLWMPVPWFSYSAFLRFGPNYYYGYVKWLFASLRGMPTLNLPISVQVDESLLAAHSGPESTSLANRD
jgi:hypothetical protein